MNVKWCFLLMLFFCCCSECGVLLFGSSKLKIKKNKGGLKCDVLQIGGLDE